jgi:hypothetical protein
MTARIVLEVIAGPNQGARVEFDRHDTFLVGRAPTAHLQLLDDACFSRHHFLECQPPRCYLHDLGSSTGELATHADAGHRAGHLAVPLAEQAAQAAEQPGTAEFDALAAAYAEAGRFPEAVANAQKAVALAAAAGPPDRVPPDRVPPAPVPGATNLPFPTWQQVDWTPALATRQGMHTSTHSAWEPVAVCS